MDFHHELFSMSERITPTECAKYLGPVIRETECRPGSGIPLQPGSCSSSRPFPHPSKLISNTRRHPLIT